MSLEIEATATTAEPQNKVSATRKLRVPSSANRLLALPMPNSTSEMATTEIMPMPEIGLEEEPTKPAI